MTDDGITARYRKVIVVAHSLGSVIADDTFNALLRTDNVHNNHLQVVLAVVQILNLRVVGCRAA
jgi:alpha-beta hydrolase superfamily lysophospholipase